MSLLCKADGFELGVGLAIIVVEAGASGAMTTITGLSQTYAFFVNQKGLMASLGLQGTKVTKTEK